MDHPQGIVVARMWAIGVAVLVVAYSSWQLRGRDEPVERVNATVPVCANGAFNKTIINNVRKVVTAPMVSVHGCTHATFASV